MQPFYCGSIVRGRMSRRPVILKSSLAPITVALRKALIHHQMGVRATDAPRQMSFNDQPPANKLDILSKGSGETTHRYKHVHVVVSWTCRVGVGSGSLRAKLTIGLVGWTGRDGLVFCLPAQ